MDELIKNVLCYYKGDVMASAIAIGTEDLSDVYPHIPKLPTKSGQFGSTYTVVHAGKHYIRKDIPFIQPADRGGGVFTSGYSETDFVNEVTFQDEVSEIGLAPKIYQAWVSNNTGTIIMDKLEDPDWIILTEILDKEEDKVAEVFTSVARGAVRMAEELNLEHRDVQPDNVFYNPETKEIKFIDFGKAKKLEKQKTPREIVANVVYTLFKGWFGARYEWILDPTKEIDFNNDEDLEKDYKTVEKIFNNLGL